MVIGAVVVEGKVAAEEEVEAQDVAEGVVITNNTHSSTVAMAVVDRLRSRAFRIKLAALHRRSKVSQERNQMKEVHLMLPHKLYRYIDFFEIDVKC
mmetsp:Transcript_30233/g.87119  ORF Transcript_30233/g.87119 Transcript_30233/m.87119 type:complete len:96 (+) Transcript_30233:1962-2249(+)